MNIHNSYFAIKNPLQIIDDWLHPRRHKSRIDFNGKELLVTWTERAERALLKRDIPLIVEMQIYFSCVVQKRILYHDSAEFPTQQVNNKLELLLRPVEAESCDPVEFAKNHPVSHEYTSTAAKNFRPSRLDLDYKNGQWCGEFGI